MRRISKGASVLLISAAMIFSAVVVTAQTQKQLPSTDCSIVGVTAAGAAGSIVWDNGMDCYIMVAAQYDPAYKEIGTTADDFHFEETTEVADVHWIGGYFGDDYQNGDFDWNITFYYDRGDGEAPGAIYAGPFIIDWDDVGRELLEDTGSSIYYELWVDLPEVVVFQGCEKFWISIRGEGAYPPQSGTCLQLSVQLHMAVWKSAYFEVYDWLDTDLQWPEYGPMDMCFQLTGPTEPTPPTPPDIDGPPEGKAGTELCWTFHSSDENGDMVRYHIDWGDGATETTDWYPECTPVEVCHTYAEKGTYTITAYAEDETGLTSGSSTLIVKIPRFRPVYTPFYLRLFERFQNAFPVLSRLLNNL